MEILSVFWLFVKYLFYLTLPVVVYLIYFVFYVPLRIRSKFRKHANVGMKESFTPVIGNLANSLQLRFEYRGEGVMRENKVGYYTIISDALSNKAVDLRYAQMGSLHVIHVASLQGIHQFQDLLYDKIDRSDLFRNFIGKLNPGSLDQIRTNPNWKKRRESFMKVIGINFASRYIPTMIECLHKQMKKWKLNTELDFSSEISQATFNVMAIILFGNDFHDTIGKPKYTHLDGKTEDLEFCEFMNRIGGDLVKGYYSLGSMIFPILNSKNLCKPHTINIKNCAELRRVLNEFLDTTKDSESVYSQIKSIQDYDSNELLVDTD